MRRIRSLEELEPLLAAHLARGFFIRLNYQLIPPRQAGPGENGEPATETASCTLEKIQNSDLGGFSSLLNQAFTVVSFHSRD